jgi:hypothetical protein
VLPELGRALYVSEQEGESACRRAGHDTLMSSLLPLRGNYSSGGFLGSFVRPSAWRRSRSPFREPETASWAASSRLSADGLQYGCSKARLGCSASPHVLPAKRHFLESRRADSKRLPLLITSDHSGVAGVCSGLQMPRF